MTGNNLDAQQPARRIRAMAQENRISVQLDPETLERIEQLVDYMVEDPVLRATGRVTKSLVIRMALDSGMDDLEERYLPKSKRRRKGAGGPR